MGNHKGTNNRSKKRMKLEKGQDKVSGLHSQRRCESSQSSGHDDRRQRSRSPQVCSRGLVTPTSRILVKGLPKETTKEHIHQILERWRPLRDVRVMTKKNTSVCRGIAFIDFPSVGAARKMMDEIGDRGLDVGGREISFEYRLGEVPQVTVEVPIVNAGVGETEQATEEQEEIDDRDYVDEVATKRLPDPWDLEEILMLKEAVHNLVKDGKGRPWKDILKYGHNVFHEGRTPEDLRSSIWLATANGMTK
ncbi:SUPPRESSOR OF ABI3-5-like [Papaver somniferum]|uniref:SUPPRESSOR OF ABI3-5-like n=1 Tax=Papaver somniferum TaxID=3469 RepID=UPI000E6F78D2|nr:SUPPRESSOR OF ABI3-5-like [Papaver somniferum]